MSETLLLALIAAVSGGAAAAGITGYFQRPRVRAESRKIAVETGELLERRWQAWANKLEVKISQLEAALLRRDAEVTELKASLEREKVVNRLVISWAMQLRDEIRRLSGAAPEPPPELRSHLGEDIE